MAGLARWPSIGACHCGGMVWKLGKREGESVRGKACVWQFREVGKGEGESVRSKVCVSQFKAENKTKQRDTHACKKPCTRISARRWRHH